MLIDKLAKAFTAQLIEDVGENIDDVRELNRHETDGQICHSHDFCDANMTMYAAFLDLFGRVMDLTSQEDMDLVNAAWDKAKQNEFADS
jgi:hypothetical protein